MSYSLLSKEIGSLVNLDISILLMLLNYKIETFVAESSGKYLDMEKRLI